MNRFLPYACFLGLFCSFTFAADDYVLGIDSQPNPSTPKGKIEKSEWKSNIFPGTVREMLIYVPAQYDGKTPAAVMIFQDGSSYANEKGQFRATIVFDNLIHKKEMPVTIGVFLNPGTVPSSNPKEKAVATVASNTIPPLINTQPSLKKKSCPKSRRNIMSAKTLQAGPFAGSAVVAFVHSLRLGNDPICLAKF